MLTTPSSNYCTSCTRGQPTLDDDEDYYREDGGGDHDQVVVDGNEDAGLVKDGDGDGARASLTYPVTAPAAPSKGQHTRQPPKQLLFSHCS